MNILLRIKNLETALITLSKRQDERANRNERGIFKTKAEALKAQNSAEEAKTDIQNVSDEIIENVGTFADFLEEYYLSQFE